MDAGVVDVPQLRTLVFGVPLLELVAEAEDALLGAALLLVATGTAEGSIELILVQGIQQGLGLHQVGVYLGAVGERPHAGMEGFHVGLHDEVPAVFLGILIAELYHLLELPFRVDVHQRERHLAGGKGFLGQAHHDAAVLADAVEHDRILKLCCHLTDDVDALGFEFLKMGKVIIICHRFFYRTYRANEAHGTNWILR